MIRRIAAVGLLVAIASGCAEQARPAKPAPALRATAVYEPVSVHDLGGRLGMSVVQSGPRMAELRGQGAVVKVFPEPASWIYVNDRPVVKSGGIVSRGNVIYVPADVEGKVREKLPAAEAAQLPRIGQTPYRSPGGRRVVIDAGHGGKDPGTHARSGMREKDLTLVGGFGGRPAASATRGAGPAHAAE